MARVRAKAHEKISDPVILQSVIDGLNQEKPITKKVACEMLNIAYNTSRLDKILDAYLDKVERQTRRRKELRSKPVTGEEKRDIINSYLSGEALAQISDDTFRSINVIKNVLRNNNVPLRDPGANYFNPIFLDDDSTADDYVEGDLVYSARYNCPAYIRRRVSDGVWSIWTTGDHAQQAVQPFYELADLRGIQNDFGIKITGYTTEEYERFIFEALQKSKKRDKK